MKHVVLISTSFPDTSLTNGREAAGTFVFDFSSELSNHIKVTVIAPSMKTKIQRLENLEIRYFGVPSLPLSLLKPKNPIHWLSIVKTLKAGQDMVSEVVNQNKIDHIFALWTLPSGYWAKKTGEKCNVPYSIWALGSDIWSLGAIPIVRMVLNSVLRKSIYRFADGFQLASDVENLCGLSCDFLPSSRNLPVKEKKKLATSPPYKLAFLGRWHPNKGIDLLLESFEYLDKADWGKISEVQICGGGPLKEFVHREANKLKEKGLPFRLRGYLNREEAAELLLWADYLLLPSRIESIPVIFSDAMQASCPVISMPTGDLSRLLKEEKVGVLASEISPKSYTKAIKQALRQEPIQYDDGIRKMQQNFSVKISVNKLLSILFGPQ